MEAFEYAALQDERRRSCKSYLEFLRHPSMSMGLYELTADSVDPQHPHNEDEVYYLVSGRAQIHVGGEDRPVGPGSVVFVAAGVEHRFHSIEEDLSVLVVFAPAETG
ncbi:MAG: cupin domain-containing protein [Caldilineaceae bacterium]|nr:cupin domain-containing protein [Caldilineaceae bacterium]